MRASLAVLLLVLLLHLCGVPKPVDAGFLQAPEDVTAPLNTNATFECSHTAEVVWQVENIQLSTQSAIDAFASLRKVFVINDELGRDTHSTLVVLASVENNQTAIVCLGFTIPVNPELSDPVTVTVFDLPSAPSSLALSVNAAQQLRLTWSPPYTLPGEDITYSVRVENLNTTSILVFGNITSTEFIFDQPAEDENCNLYQFTVFAVNAVGQSEPSNSETSTIPVVPGQVSEISTTVSLEGGVSVTLAFESPDVCPDYPVLTYNVTARNTAGIVIPLGMFPATGTMELFTSNSSIGLEENTEYTATVVAENMVGSSTSSEITFYTSDVQTAVIESVNSQSLKVTCTFAVGTQTRGCRVQILRTNDPQNPYYTLNVERSTTNPLVAEATDAMQFPSEAFEVIAFDWEADGTISNFGIPVEVIGGPIPPSSATPSSSSTSLSTSLPTSPLISQGTTVEPSLTLAAGPTFSPGLSPTLSPIPSNVITTSESQGSSSPGLIIIIIGCVVGAVVLLLVAIVVVNVIICTARRNRKGRFPVGRDGRDSQSPSHVYFKEPGNDELVPPVIYEPIPACEPGRRELVPSPTYPHPPATLNPMTYSEYEVMSPSYKAEVRYAVPTGRPVDGQPQTEVGTPLYEVISTKRGVANGTSHGTNGNAGVSLVAPNPQYGETVAATSRSDGGVFAVAHNPYYGEPTSRSDGGVFTGPPPPWPYGEPPPVSPKSVVPQYPPGTSRSDSGVVTSPFNRQYSAPTSSSASGVVAVAPNPQYGEIGEFTGQHSITNV